MATVFGIGASWAAAYVAMKFNNIMDLLQLVFAFVNAPLFATFLLGMFWARATANGAFYGLLSGTIAAGIHHGLSLPIGSQSGLKGGWMGAQTIYPSEMAQNFWTAIWAWSTCFAVTIAISLVTQVKSPGELKNLVYAYTEMPKDPEGMRWYQKPAALGALILLAVGLLNILFW